MLFSSLATGNQGLTTGPLLLYYITGRTQFSGSEPERRKQLLIRIGAAARVGVDYIQLREKDLPSRELEGLAREVVREVRANGDRTRVLVNSRTDVALAAAADGVHLRSHDISPADVRRIWRAGGRKSEALIAVSCHTDDEIKAAQSSGADFAVFGPVFGKSGSQGTGFSALSSASSHEISVLALGGVTAENAKLCLERGAAGLAGIRLFQQGDLENTVRALRR